MSSRKLTTSFALVMIPMLALLMTNPATYFPGLAGISPALRSPTAVEVRLTSSSASSSVVSFSLRYVVSGGGNASAPWFAFTFEGVHQNMTLSRAPTNYQLDANSTWNAETTIPGILGERWILTSPNGIGTVLSIANMNLVFKYAHQYRLMTAVDPVDAGTATPTEEWVNSAGVAQVQASPNPGFMFDHWSCEGNGCVSGSQNPILVTLNGPMLMASHFLQVSRVVIQSLNGNGFMIVDDSYSVELNPTSPYIPNWRVNSTHTIQAFSNASCGFDIGPFQGCRYQFQQWLVNGATPTSSVSGDTYSFEVSGRPTSIAAVYHQDYTNLERVIVLTIGIVAAILYLKPKRQGNHRSTRKAKSAAPLDLKPVPKWCANCGAINPHDNAFCGKCGFNLDATRVYE